MDYDINKKIGVHSATNSSSSNTSLLDGYIEVPPSDWSLLPSGSHIRFERNGKIQSGGFIHSIKISEPATMFVQNGFNPGVPGYVKFPLILSGVSRIWRKDNEYSEYTPLSQSTPLSQMMVPQFQNPSNDRIEAIEKKLMQMQSDIDKLNATNSRFISIINKLLNNRNPSSKTNS